MIETDICIIGAGPAGMMAACFAAGGSKKVVIIESNTTAGRKLLLTGRGRCNLTHTGTTDEIIKAYKPFDRFVRHCIYTFPPHKLRQFFACRGLETIQEADGCVFPKSQKSSDVKRVFFDELKKLNVRMFYGSKVQSVKPVLSEVEGKDKDIFIILSEKFKIAAKSLIIATGGVSWPHTGSTGDGCKFAQLFGHNIIEPKACVVPLVTQENLCSYLAGIGIENVRISCTIDGKKISSSGPMIFTHNGIGGPAVLDLSRLITDQLGKNHKAELSIDLLPDITEQQLDKKLTEILTQYPKRNIASVIAQYVPKALAEVICSAGGFADTAAGQLTKKDRKMLIENLKSFRLTVLSAEPIEKATVTRGGIDIAQIDPKTMQSRLCSGLFFAGEVINVDGPCGGYNLQFAFSSGFLAGKSAVELLR
jgi:predicted Rossmann fold flavoprotein